MYFPSNVRDLFTGPIKKHEVSRKNINSLFKLRIYTGIVFRLTSCGPYEFTLKAAAAEKRVFIFLRTVQQLNSLIVSRYKTEITSCTSGIHCAQWNCPFSSQGRESEILHVLFFFFGH